LTLSAERGFKNREEEVERKGRGIAFHKKREGF